MKSLNFEYPHLDIVNDLEEGEVVELFISGKANIYPNRDENDSLGKIDFHQFNAKRYHPSDIREECDCLDSQCHKIISSVRIFPNLWEMEEFTLTYMICHLKNLDIDSARYRINQEFNENGYL